MNLLDFNFWNMWQLYWKCLPYVLIIFHIVITRAFYKNFYLNFSKSLLKQKFSKKIIFDSKLFSKLFNAINNFFFFYLDILFFYSRFLLNQPYNYFYEPISVIALLQQANLKMQDSTWPSNHAYLYHADGIPEKLSNIQVISISQR